MSDVVVTVPKSFGLANWIAEGDAAGGAFNNPRGRLRSLGLIEYPQPGFVVARPLLFLESR